MPTIDRCGQCGAEILWATSNATGKRAPLDRRPWPEYGNIDLDATRMTYVVLTDPEVLASARTRGFNLYTNHLGTCPARERQNPVDEQENELYEHAAS